MKPPDLCIVTEFLKKGYVHVSLVLMSHWYLFIDEVDVLFTISFSLWCFRSLEDALNRINTKKKELKMSKIIQWSVDIARGLNWLHHKGIIHRYTLPFFSCTGSLSLPFSYTGTLSPSPLPSCMCVCVTQRSEARQYLT